ncbi:hypothetical protein [Mammaliicoccus sciuri]|uniref:hypothetical protein n=1 Tax=Mammaliicoccus sciuri TaxID=1296 RepID=UPI000E6A1C4D|nr:hypothetical protein [Mammaliicoccus sciuri]RIN92403.1 hypothetical protein BU003_02120 [Mammaliicoccus sciuri]
MKNRRFKQRLLGLLLMSGGLVLSIINIKNDTSIIFAIGMILAVIGLCLSMYEVYKKKRYDLIDDINAALLELGYTDEQIKDKEKSLYRSDIDEIKAIKSKVEIKINQKRTDDFFNMSENKEL